MSLHLKKMQEINLPLNELEDVESSYIESIKAQDTAKNTIEKAKSIIKQDTKHSEASKIAALERYRNIMPLIKEFLIYKNDTSKILKELEECFNHKIKLLTEIHGKKNPAKATNKSSKPQKKRNPVGTQSSTTPETSKIKESLINTTDFKHNATEQDSKEKSEAQTESASTLSSATLSAAESANNDVQITDERIQKIDERIQSLEEELKQIEEEQQKQINEKNELNKKRLDAEVEFKKNALQETILESKFMIDVTSLSVNIQEQLIEFMTNPKKFTMREFISLITGLGGDIKYKSGSHGTVSFKGTNYKFSVVNPHGKSDDYMGYVNQDITRRGLSQILPEDWEQQIKRQQNKPNFSAST